VSPGDLARRLAGTARDGRLFNLACMAEAVALGVDALTESEGAGALGALACTIEAALPAGQAPAAVPQVTATFRPGDSLELSRDAVALLLASLTAAAGGAPLSKADAIEAALLLALLRRPLRRGKR
jgi:hypothetical protein